MATQVNQIKAPMPCKTNAQQFVKGWVRVMWIQILHSFSINGSLKIVLGVAMPTILMLTTVIIGSDSAEKTSDQVEVSRLIAQGEFFGVLLALITSTLTNIRDRSKLDKNRISYLRFGKQSVALGKVTGASLRSPFKSCSHMQRSLLLIPLAN